MLRGPAPRQPSRGGRPRPGSEARGRHLLLVLLVQLDQVLLLLELLLLLHRRLELLLHGALLRLELLLLLLQSHLLLRLELLLLLLQSHLLELQLGWRQTAGRLSWVQLREVPPRQQGRDGVPRTGLTTNIHSIVTVLHSTGAQSTPQGPDPLYKNPIHSTVTAICSTGT